MDLDININGQFYKVHLLSMQAGEIKKSTQPSRDRLEIQDQKVINGGKCGWKKETETRD